MNAARAYGSACGVRSPERYGRKRTPSAPGSTPSASADELVVRRARGERVPEPAQRPGGREHHAHRVPGSRDRVAEHVQPRLGLGLVGRQRREHDPGGAEDDRERARPVDADAERAGRLVAGAGGDRSPVRGPTRDLRRLERRGQPFGRDLERVEDLAAPAPLGDVEQERPGGIRDVGRVLAGQPQPHVVLREEHVADPRVGVRLVLAQPEQLRRGEAGERAVARQADQPLDADPPLDLLALGRRCAGRSRGSPAGSPRSSPSRATRPCIWPERPIPAALSAPTAASAASLARHQSSGSCSAQPGAAWRAGTPPPRARAPRPPARRRSP